MKPIQEIINFEYRGNEAFRPKYQTTHATGLDLVSQEPLLIEPGDFAMIGTGLYLTSFKDQSVLMHVESNGADALLYHSLYPKISIQGRSGLNSRGILSALGLVDPDYRGEIKVCLYNFTKQPFLISPGDRIAQLVVGFAYQVPGFEAVSRERGEGGFGSTGGTA